MQLERNVIVDYTPAIVESAIRTIAGRIKLTKTDYSCVIAPVRGGLVPGVMLSHILGIPLFPLSYSLRDHKAIEDVPWSLINFVEARRDQPVLIIDDIVDGGDTMLGILEHLAPIPIIDVAALIHNIEAPVKVRFSHSEIKRSEFKEWFNFYWELS